MLSSLCQAGNIISAELGSLHKLSSDKPINDRSVNFDFRIRKLEKSENDWLPMAYVAATDKEQNSEFQVFLVKSKDANDLTIGHRYVENGKVIFEKPIFHGVPIYGYVEARITVNETGLVHVESSHLKLKHEYKTNLKVIHSSLAVSGATAEFSAPE